MGAMRATVVAAMALLCGGCGPQLGVMLYHSGLVPEPKAKPQFELTRKKVAILVDDPMGVLPDSSIREHLHDALADELDRNEASGPVARAAELAELERTNRHFDSLSARAIGEKLQAEQIICVAIQEFTLGKDARHGVYQGRAKAMVKVCTTERKSDVRLWPDAGVGQSLEVALPTEQLDGPAAGRGYAKALAERLAKRVAMQFYEHPVEAETILATGRTEEKGE